MSKRILHDDWERLGYGSFELDISAGRVRVFDEDRKRWLSYKFPPVYRQLIQRAYEDGRKDRLPYVRS